jgi:hypothetical protein
MKHFKIGWGMHKLWLDEVFWWKLKLKGAQKIEAPSKRRQKPKIIKWKKILILNEDYDENSGWSISEWISSTTLEPHNYCSTSPIQACDTILERAGNVLQHRLLKIPIKRKFSLRYNIIGREVVQSSIDYKM